MGIFASIHSMTQNSNEIDQQWSLMFRYSSLNNLHIFGILSGYKCNEVHVNSPMCTCMRVHIYSQQCTHTHDFTKCGFNLVTVWPLMNLWILSIYAYIKCRQLRTSQWIWDFENVFSYLQLRWQYLYQHISLLVPNERCQSNGQWISRQSIWIHEFTRKKKNFIIKSI